MIKKIFLFLILIQIFLPFSAIRAENSDFITTGELPQKEKVDIYLFEREGCSHCAKEIAFFENLIKERSDFNLIIVDIFQEGNRQQFNFIVEKYNLSKVTPTTIIGENILQGFNSPETTGEQIISLIEKNKLKQQEPQGNSVLEQNFKFTVPFIGVVNLKNFSLFSLSFILGLVDGFNPCAMWVLMTFLLILWQIKNKKKMFQIAGLFILAEAVMYYLILNFWFKTWNFVGLNKIITPIIGVLSLGAGIYFLYRYWRNRGKLVCNTDVEKQSKTKNKINDLINSPMTMITIFGIIGIALSVNIVEFACSIGVPQAFTKILELNHLNLVTEQFFILLYTFAYMLDDLLLFGLALYGFSKFYTVGQKYSNLSSLFGGVLMVILGLLFLFSPNILIF